MILGNGAGDIVNLLAALDDIITVGNGAGDTVNGYANQLYGVRSSTIRLGNGAGDTVAVTGSHYNTITLGNGAHDLVHLRRTKQITAATTMLSPLVVALEAA